MEALHFVFFFKKKTWVAELWITCCLHFQVSALWLPVKLVSQHPFFVCVCVCVYLVRLWERSAC